MRFRLGMPYGVATVILIITVLMIFGIFVHDRFMNKVRKITNIDPQFYEAYTAEEQVVILF